MKRLQVQQLHDKLTSGAITHEQAWYMARWYSLKPSERQVVMLVADGLHTAAEIAAHTGIAHNAVATALKGACDLGILTRREEYYKYNRKPHYRYDVVRMEL